MQQDKLLVACPQCFSANRVPAARLAENPKCGKCGTLLLEGRPLAMDEAAFPTFLARTELPVLADFWAEWCGPCKMMAPAFERAAVQMRTRASFVKVDTDRAQALAGRYGIRSIPTLILFRGGRELDRVSGAMDARSIVGWLEAKIGTDPIFPK